MFHPRPSLLRQNLPQLNVLSKEYTTFEKFLPSRIFLLRKRKVLEAFKGFRQIFIISLPAKLRTDPKLAPTDAAACFRYITDKFVTNFFHQEIDSKNIFLS